MVLQMTAPQPSSNALPMTLALVPGGPEAMTNGLGSFKPSTVTLRSGMAHLVRRAEGKCELIDYTSRSGRGPRKRGRAGASRRPGPQRRRRDPPQLLAAVAARGLDRHPVHHRH